MRNQQVRMREHVFLLQNIIYNMDPGIYNNRVRLKLRTL